VSFLLVAAMLSGRPVVLDGTTIVLDGTHIRIANINAPKIHHFDCDAELRLDFGEAAEGRSFE
jgi:micrococcal nuclease